MALEGLDRARAALRLAAPAISAVTTALGATRLAREGRRLERRLDLLAGLGLARRRRRVPLTALLVVGAGVVAIGALLLPRGARVHVPLRERAAHLLQRGQYWLLKTEYRMEETAQRAADKIEQQARVAEQIVENEVEGTRRAVAASLDQAKAAAR
jgi:hypothetical protein